MANIGSSWKKFLVIGCSHGALADPTALKHVLRITKDFKPHVRIHAGDFLDTTAFRGGARDTPDETASIKDDLQYGLQFLEQFEATHIINGNHEDRVFRLMHHHQEILARAAGSVVQEIRDMAKKLKAQHVEDYNISKKCWVEIGDTRVLHGFVYGEQALRDHAEHFGKSIIAHLHTAGMAHGRREDRPTCTCVGTLSTIPNHEYAKTRRATARWSQGLVAGEFNDREAVYWLSERCKSGEWRFPA